MNRTGFERIKRRHLRLTLEHLESRRLMAGLNVLVFADQDGSRSLDRAVDAPAANRLVYVDINRNLRFEDGEPLAISGIDGVARFPNLVSGDYLVGLATSTPNQLLTTSVVSDSRATFLRPVATQSVIASADLRHAWSVSESGELTPVGSADLARSAMRLGGPIISSTGVASSALSVTTASGLPTSVPRHEDAGSAWALVDAGATRPTLVRLDLEAGVATTVPIDGLAASTRVTGVARMGDQLVVQLQDGENTYVASATTVAGHAVLGARIAVPSGRLVGSSLPNRLAIINNDAISDFGTRLHTIRLADNVASIETMQSEHSIKNVALSGDGRYLFGSLFGGGVQVFSTINGLKSAAFLAEAAGPIAVTGRDGRLVTANANKTNELIVWDSANWQPVSRIELAEQSSPVISIIADPFGEKVLAATAQAMFAASLANPTPQPVQVSSGTHTTVASLGVRVVSPVQPLPASVKFSQTTLEDTFVEIDLASHPALAALTSTRLIFAPGSGAHMGTVLVTPTGRVSYRPAANRNGDDSATLKIYDGISTSTLVLSLNVQPVNDSPSAFTVDPVALFEAADNGAPAGFATVFDVDTDASYLITTSDPRFLVVNGQIVRSDVGTLDFETEAAVKLDVTATDLTNPAFVLTRHVTIPVLDSNDAPSGLTVSATSIQENSPGSSLGKVDVTDIDHHGDYVYSISDARFEVVNGQLQLRPGEQLDYETEPEVSLTISVSDPTAEGQSRLVTTTVRVEVVDSNDAPTGITVISPKVKSGQAGAVVGTIDVIDQDPIEEYNFVVSDPRFIVEGRTLRLRDGAVVDRTEQTSVPVLVTVTDASGNIISQTVTVTVINDAPFQNPSNPLDVDNDGKIYPRDVIILIDQLNRKGPHIIQPPTASGEGGTIPHSIYIDVNGDGFLTPLDVLILINHLNGRKDPSLIGGEGPPALDSQPVGDSEPAPDSKPGAFVTTANDAEPLACEPFIAQQAPPLASPFELSLQERVEHASLDAELELLLEQLSRERLR